MAYFCRETGARIAKPGVCLAVDPDAGHEEVVPGPVVTELLGKGVDEVLAEFGVGSVAELRDSFSAANAVGAAEHQDEILAELGVESLAELYAKFEEGQAALVREKTAATDNSPEPSNGAGGDASQEESFDSEQSPGKRRGKPKR